MPSHYGSPDNPMVVGTRGHALRMLLRSVVLAGLGWVAVAALVDVARPAAAGPVQHSGGAGTGTASAVDFSEAARSPDARTLPPPNPRLEEFHRRVRPPLPSRPTSGTRARCRMRWQRRTSRLLSPATSTASASWGDAAAATYRPTPTPPPAAPRSSSWSIRSSRSQTPPAPSCVAAA